MSQSENTSVRMHSSEVRTFVAAVRSRLLDLTEEEREELIGGLDADMGDLVAEQGVHALPDPTSYAAELRSAAGFSAEAPSAKRTSRVRRDGVTAWLDRGSSTWNRWVDTGEHLGLPELLHSLRSVWWVLRALCATALITEIWSSQGVFGFTFLRTLVAVAAVVGSVQLGRGAWRLGSLIRRSLFLRLVLVGLNVFAVLLLPLMFDRFMTAGGYDPYTDSGPAYTERDGLVLGGEQIGNIYAYDADGNPLVGIQLVDQDGRRLPVASTRYDENTNTESSLAPWMNGRTQLFSVFPLPERTGSDSETGERQGPARLLAPPFASLSPVTLSGVTPSVLAATSERETRSQTLRARKKAVAAKRAEERRQR